MSSGFKTDPGLVLSLRVSDDSLSAVVSTKPSFTTSIDYTVTELIEWFESQGVHYGIKEDAVTKLAAALTALRPIKNLLIAEGLPAVNGEDGWIDYKITTSLAAGQVSEDGNVDFRERGIINNTHVDMLLAQVMKPTDGEAGVTVKGKPISAEPGRDAVPPKGGDGVEVSEDHVFFVALLEGHAQLSEGTLTVSREFHIEGDVDFKTGNIDFVGDLVISGAVISGFEVKAKGNISIGGNIERNAVVSSEGSITVGDTIRNGRDKAFVTAEGNVTAVKVDNAYIKARGDVIVEKEVIGSKVKCYGKFIGSKAEIRGSEIEAVSGIEIGKVGSDKSETRNVLTAGITLEAAKLHQESIEKSRSLKETAVMIKNNFEKKFALSMNDEVAKFNSKTDDGENEESDDSQSGEEKYPPGAKKAISRFMTLLERIRAEESNVAAYEKEIEEKPDTIISIARGVNPICVINFRWNEWVVRKAAPPTIFFDNYKYDRIGTRSFKEGYVRNAEEDDVKTEEQVAEETEIIRQLEVKIESRKVSARKLSLEINKFSAEDSTLYAQALSLGLKALQQKRYQEPDVFVSVSYALYRMATKIPDAAESKKYAAKALGFLGNILAKDKLDAQAISTLALIYKFYGQDDKADECHKKAIDIISKLNTKGSPPDIYSRYAAYLCENGKEAERSGDSDKAEGLYKMSADNYNKAIKNGALGDLKKLCNRALKELPEG
ncbi:MAG: FapA family protein [Planctomycetota bacterium]|jgi:uncharacterized protein (DUF342 family)